MPQQSVSEHFWGRRIIEVFAKNYRVLKPWFAKYKNAVWLKPELVGTAHFMYERRAACASPSGRAFGKMSKKLE